MTGLRDLYQEVILDHNRRPRNFRVIPEPTCTAEGRNPLCGDQLTVHLRLKDGVVEDAAFQGSGCAISKASASLMTDAVKGKRVEDVEALFDAVRQMVTGQPASATTADVGKLTVLSGVAEFPMRVKCATLAWHTMHAALTGSNDPATTETD